LVHAGVAQRDVVIACSKAEQVERQIDGDILGNTRQVHAVSYRKLETMVVCPLLFSYCFNFPMYTSSSIVYY
jgi:hypothetical protein